VADGHGGVVGGVAEGHDAGEGGAVGQAGDVGEGREFAGYGGAVEAGAQSLARRTTLTMRSTVLAGTGSVR